MAALSHWASADSAGLRRQSRSGSFLGPPRLFTAPYYPAVQQTVVVDGALPGSETKDEAKVRKRETIFGPDVGDDDQPGWTEGGDGTAVSVDVIKRWVDTAKGEEGLHTTTTLQALVNLKRPSLLLHPLNHAPEADSKPAPAPPVQPLHQLKFHYDAMTSLVKITLSLYPAPHNKSGEVVAPEPPKVLYTGLHPGGFNKLFDLPSEDALDLNLAIVPIPPVEEAIAEEGDGKAAAPRASETTSRTSGERAEASTQPDTTALPEHQEEQQQGRRFGLFRRQREPDVEANIEMTPTNEPPVEEDKKEEDKKEDEHGMRLIISLEAVGPDGEPLRRRNAQLTHILVSGTWAPDAGSTHHIGAGKRVWVVKVVRREAQIGEHNFLLKEIYGLSSAAGADSTYPPTLSDPYASAPNECIVCLTNPRDVVLLPCRHLVVCRECAVGMVEFGAGGRVARREDEAAPATGGAETTPGATEEPPQMGTGVGGVIAPAPAPRRKKKAKGWYCPVCRQPYTSLLRLALPPSKEGRAATPGVVEPVQRAGSIRSMRTTRSTRSVATLPRGAEEMLSGLGPELSDDEDDERDAQRIGAREGAPEEERERPQFVIAETTTNPPPPTGQQVFAKPTTPPPAHLAPPDPPVPSTPNATADASGPATHGVAALRVE